MLRLAVLLVDTTDSICGLGRAVLFAIPYDQLTPQRLPWVTWALAGAWLTVAALSAAGWPAGFWADAGLLPAAPAERGLALHWLLHESWAHLLAGLALILIIGPALEEAWGSALFGGFFAATLLFGTGSYLLAAGDSMRPLVGASAALAALIAAFVFRFRESGVGYTAVAWWRGPVHTSLRVPAWSIAAVWFVCEVSMQLAGQGDGVTRGVSYGAQIASAAMGLVTAIAVQHFDIERRLGRLPEGAPHPALAAAVDAREEHGPMAAVSLLEPAVRERPEDGDLVAALCENACAGGEPGRATEAFLALLRSRLQGGADEAAALWLRWARPLARPALDLRVRVRLADAVRRSGDGLETARLLRPVLQAGDAFTPGLALRVVDLVRDAHAGIALEAIARALEAPDLHEAKREKLTGLRDTLTQRLALEPDPVLEDEEEVTVEDRSIEIEPDEDLRRPPPGFGLETTANDADTQPLGLSADGQLESAGAEFADLSGGTLADTAPILDPVGAEQSRDASESGPVAPLPDPVVTPAGDSDMVDVGLSAAAGIARFADAKRDEAVPILWEPGRVCLRRGSGAPVWLELSQVEAIAATAVRGLAAKPVIVIDLLLNWTELQERPLRLVRWRSDRFDPAGLRPELGQGLAGFRKLVEVLLFESGGAPLPDEKSARGAPFRMFDDIDAYEREVLELDV